jgi:hypothetical protein
MEDIVAVRLLFLGGLMVMSALAALAAHALARRAGGRAARSSDARDAVGLRSVGAEGTR